MRRKVRRSKVRRPARDGSRQIAVVAAVAVCLVLGAFATGEYVTESQRKTAPAATAAAVVVAKTGRADELYTGSILYMPNEGKLCRQFLFDNHTGRFSDNGVVDCVRAAYRGTNEPPKQWSFDRMRAVSSGFQR